MMYFLCRIRWAPARIVGLLLALPIVLLDLIIDTAVNAPGSFLDPRFYNFTFATLVAAFDGRFVGEGKRKP